MGNGPSGPASPVAQIRIEAIQSLDDVYVTRAELGSGKYATCFEAEARGARKRSSPKVVAIKALYKNHKYYKKSRAEVEVRAWQGLRHPGIVRLLEVLEDPVAIWLVQELAGGSTMQQRINSLGCFEEEAAIHMVGQVLSAVAYMHSMGVSHRDIKPANILMVSDDASSEDYERVKLCDFGLAHAGKATVARPDPDNEKHTMKTLCGSPSYLAPEVAWPVYALQESRRRQPCRSLDGEARSPTTLPEASYTCLVDVWSCGVLAYVMVSGSHPFSEWADLLRGEIEFEGAGWATASNTAVHFVTHVLVVDPAKRPTAAESLAHPWLAHTGSAAHGRDLLRGIGGASNKLSFRQRVSSAVRNPLAGLSSSGELKDSKENLMRLPLTSRAWNEVDPSGGSSSPIRAAVRQSTPSRSRRWHLSRAQRPPSVSVDSPMSQTGSGGWGSPTSQTGSGGWGKVRLKKITTTMRRSTSIESALHDAARSSSCEDGTLVRRMSTGRSPIGSLRTRAISRRRAHLPSLERSRDHHPSLEPQAWAIPDVAHPEPESPSHSRLRSLGRKLQGKGVGDSRADSPPEREGLGSASVGGDGAGAALDSQKSYLESIGGKKDARMMALSPLFGDSSNSPQVSESGS